MRMRAVRQVRGRAVPLDRSDVDTDQIIPASWLKRVERTGFGEGLFSEWRKDPAFVLNRPEYAGAKVLVAGPNFGVGSSREHAVWALMDYGFEAVVSPRFGDIFRTNATKQGLVPAEVDPDAARAIMEAVTRDPALEVVVDVERSVVEAGSIQAAFPLDEATRARLVNGWDDIAITLRHEAAIAAYEQRRPAWMPSLAQATAWS
jgi:3-isopropylmalate/(R)-2-methylmalate dehydratase small subunit